MACYGARRFSAAIALMWCFDIAALGNNALAQTQTYYFDIPRQSLAASLRDYARISGQQIIFTNDLVAKISAMPLRGTFSTNEALARLLAGSGLAFEKSDGGGFMIRLEGQRQIAPQRSAKAEKEAAPPSATERTDVAGTPEVESVIVSGTRITASGFTAPTPTTILTMAEIRRTAQPDVFGALTQLPALQNSPGTQSNASNFSTGANGLTAFNLRGFGTIRTLTLIDNQRIVPAHVTGINDISELPQLLIERVDVVTGGASASWGSDAVGGVINFVTEKYFNGIKGNIETGISNYGDEANALLQFAAGSNILGGKGHIEAALEYFHNDGVPPPLLPGGALTNGRCCNYHTGTLSYTAATTPAGLPQFTPIMNAQTNSASEYGLVTAGPLKGTAFDANGNITQFQYGSPCVAVICVGGDLTNSEGRTTIETPLNRTVFFTRISYELLPSLQVYGTFNLGNAFTSESPPQGNKNGLTIQCGNAAGAPNFYLPAAINDACDANAISTLTVGVSYDKFPQTVMHTLRRQRRYVLGANGAFNLAGANWAFESYVEHGESDTSIHVTRMFLPARYLAAVDAVAGPGGSVVCRSAVAQASGCAPFDVFGAVALSQQALDYIDPPAVGIYSLTNERQDVFSLSINGTPFRDWAGDMALAFGAEYREEAYRTLADPYGDGVSPSNPFTRDYPADPILNANGNNWYAGNFHHGGGNYHVFEAFAEADAPLFNTMRLGRADLNVAGRATEYSTSGFVDTWKIGITWNMPMDGVRLRALQSRDVRAPNLSELFAAPIITNAGVTNRLLPATAPNVAVLNDAIGNPNLKPETAQTTDIGLIFQPSYFPRLNLSIDYYRVNAKKQIGVLTSQQEVDLCQIYGNASYCNQFYLNGAAGTSNPNYVIVRPFNLTETTTDGFDVEMRYQFELHDFGIPGDFILRNLATHVSKYIVDTGVIGQPVAEFAGAQVSAAPASSQFQSGVPLWKIFLNQSWDVAPLSFNITERIFSNTVLNPYGTVCQAPNCPPSTAQTPTYSEMNAPGYIYVDVGMSYQISKSWQTYLGINNVGDSLPKAFAPLNSDPVGRVFRFGVRFNN